MNLSKFVGVIPRSFSQQLAFAKEDPPAALYVLTMNVINPAKTASTLQPKGYAASIGKI